MESIRVYREKLKNKVIQSDGFIVKESRRYNVSALINRWLSGLRKDYIACCYINDGYLMK